MQAAVYGRALRRKISNSGFLRPSRTWYSALKNEPGNPGVKPAADYPDEKHTLDKNHDLDPQAEGKQRAYKDKQQDGGGVATTQRDAQKSEQNAKREFPEAPTTIGMQDERGGRGA